MQSNVAICAVAPLAGPATSFRILPSGRFRAGDGRPAGIPGWHLDARLAADLVKQAAAQANDYVIDYEHQSLSASTSGKPAPAAGWFKTLEWREGEGLYATNVRWTDTAAQMLGAREYRYVSPAFLYDPASGNVLQLINAAITNTPALDGLTDLAAATTRLSAAALAQESDSERAKATFKRVFGEVAELPQSRPTVSAKKRTPMSAYQRERTNASLTRVFGANAVMVKE